MTVISPLMACVTYAIFAAREYATKRGSGPVGWVTTTLSFWMSMTDTFPSTELVTKAKRFSASRARSCAPRPVLIDAAIFRAATSITVTPDILFAISPPCVTHK